MVTQKAAATHKERNYALLPLNMLQALSIASSTAGVCLEAAEALLVTSTSRDYPQHIKAHCLAQGPAGADDVIQLAG